MTETARQKPAYRRWWFWLLVLGLVYLVTGFGLIPLYLSSAVPKGSSSTWAGRWTSTMSVSILYLFVLPGGSVCH